MTTPQTPAAPKMGTLMNMNRVVVPSKAQASLSVAVRVRPILKSEQQASSSSNKRDIIRVIDGKIVVVLDPDEIKDYLDQVQNRTKEKRYTFDVAYDTQARNSDVYMGSIQELAAGVTKGLNGTVFAYGATGSGKTHTMVGTPNDPGLMVLSLSHIFREKAAQADSGEEFTVTCSYLEVYNEVIYDLLVKNSGPLELREDPDQGVCVAGLKHIQVTSAAEIMGLLEEGNRRRKTDSTDANAASSRSHAVLEIVVRRWSRNQYRANVLIGKLTLVDLAGSERAAETNNAGQKLRDGANINKSLLALANCINALGKQQKTGVAYVPYRNSKLTRLLKDSLRGNSRTAMVATIGAAADQYHHSVNTLKYADRAKEIKTHVVQNVGSVERHITDYQNIIDNLQNEVQSLKARLADRPTGAAGSTEALGLPGGTAGAAADDGAADAGAAAAGSGGVDGGSPGSSKAPGSAVCSNAEADTLAWIDALAQEINENVEERINLQKALFELEDINVCNQYELQNIEDMLKAGAASGPEEAAEAQERRTVLLEEIQENDAEAQRYRADIAANEATRREIQAKIETAIDANSNVNFLKILSTFRIQAVRLQELKFQMAVRDQIISEQRDVISNLWSILGASGLTRQQVMDIARAQGIVMQGLEQHDELSGSGAQGSSELACLSSLPQGGCGSAGGVLPGMPSLALPGAPAGVQQSLMGGKARFRYRFWQQYQAGDTHSTGGSPIQSLHSPVVLHDPPHSHRNRRQTEPSLAAAAAGADGGSHQGKPGSRIPAFPALPGRVSPRGLAAGGAGGAGAHSQLQHNVRSSSPLRGRPGAVQQGGSSSSSSSNQQPNISHADRQQQPQQQLQNKHNLVKRSASDVSPERVRPAAAAAAGGGPGGPGAQHYQHQQQQQQQAGGMHGLKRYNLPGPGQAAAAAVGYAGSLRRHSSGGILQSSIDLSSMATATAAAGPSSNDKGQSHNNGSSTANEKNRGYYYALAQLGHGAGAHGSAASSSSSLVEAHPTSARGGQGGRRRHNNGRRKARHNETSSSMRSSSSSSLHPGLPGQQQQLENALSALRKVKSQAAAAATEGGIQRTPQLLHHHQHHGMLAWQEHGQHVAAQQQQQLKRLQKEQQLSAAYGAPDKLAKLQHLRHHQHSRISSVAVSAEPSNAECGMQLPEHSTASAGSHSVAAGLPAAAAGHRSSYVGAVEHHQVLSQPQQQQQQQHWPSLVSTGGLPAISESKHNLAELRRQQLQALQQHRMSKEV